MISEGEMRRALNFLQESAAEVGKLRENAIYTERQTKRILAFGKQAHSDKPANVQEREAYAADAYHKAIMAEAKALGQWEYIKARRDHAATLIEVWRTLEANHRAANRGG